MYDCKVDAGGKLVWQFREPIATLLMDGKTVGRHYAGPNWELLDGSAVSGKVAGRSSGATQKDIPLLKLDVASTRGTGLLTGVTTIQRLNHHEPCRAVRDAKHAFVLLLAVRVEIPRAGLRTGHLTSPFPASKHLRQIFIIG